ncbi:hypothetical protein CEUSTIGMA_g9842.t1 [Chlamydomonas eustigma]|uniref:Uncharacterized protein n=1 Tax=Chlamydomonas eustigma TaxID=1157962 RepID=A0A250XH60_9CHLO|nr:hypothetical protein CEUSTIGMA_g9842.t1 [Chlamydomonas eustigma]|eukprot:GAX82414.1 hypothetical protein CEUSTIGMA_g9842.t1 [Chlamydomonas eustigma]
MCTCLIQASPDVQVTSHEGNALSPSVIHGEDTMDALHQVKNVNPEEPDSTFHGENDDHDHHLQVQRMIQQTPVLQDTDTILQGEVFMGAEGVVPYNAVVNNDGDVGPGGGPLNEVITELESVGAVEGMSVIVEAGEGGTQHMPAKASHKADVETAHDPGMGADVETAHDPGMGAGFETAHDPGMGADVETAHDPGMGADVETAHDPGLRADVETAHDPGMGANVETAHDPGLRADVETAHDPGLRVDVETAHDSGMGADVETAHEPGTGADVETAHDPGLRAWELQLSDEATFESMSERGATITKADLLSRILDGSSKDDIHENLQKAYDSLFGYTHRDLGSGLKQLLNVYSFVARAQPEARVRSHFPSTPFGAPDPDKRSSSILGLQEADFVDTGVDVASNSAFSLAAFQTNGILSREGLKPNISEALYKLHAAAYVGSPEANYALANRFMHGHDVPRNEDLALKFARKAADKLVNEMEKSFNTAPPLVPVDLRVRWMDRGYLSGIEAENSAYLMQLEQEFALKGNVEALSRVAYRRLMGQGVDADLEAAYEDFVEAAQLGDVNAIFNLGYMHLIGIHVPLNLTVARGYFETAASKGMPAAYSALGTIYWMGHDGQPSNTTAAFLSFEKGAALNDADSVINLGILYQFGLGTEIDTSKAFEQFVRGDKLGHRKAVYSLGMCYQEGIGTEVNRTKALQMYSRFFRERALWTEAITAATQALDIGDEWTALAQYILVAEQGSTVGVANAAWMLMRGASGRGEGFPEGRQQQQALALKLYSRAVKQGCISCAIELGHAGFRALRKGSSHDGHEDSIRALEWYQKAADANSSEGLYLVGWAHQRGFGAAINLSAASHWYAMSINAAGQGRWAYQVAPRLGLLSVKLDKWAQPRYGDDFVGQLLDQLKRLLRLDTGSVSTQPPFSVSQAVHDNEENIDHHQKSGVPRRSDSKGKFLQLAPTYWLDIIEYIVLTVLIVALTYVLAEHRRRFVGRLR